MLPSLTCQVTPAPPRIISPIDPSSPPCGSPAGVPPPSPHPRQDPDVQAAVAVLQQLKLRVASLRELLQAYVDSPSWLLAHLGPGISLTSSM